MGISEPLWLKRPPLPPQYPSRHNASGGLGGRWVDKYPYGKQPLSKLVSLNLPSTAGQSDARRKKVGRIRLQREGKLMVPEGLPWMTEV